MSQELKATSSSMQEPYRFNVGGTRYEVAQSLLNQYPDTMLSRLTSETWNDGDATKDIFIERDGESFRHVLRFLRDGKVVLPLSEPKEMFIADLQFYGIDYATDSIQQLTDSPGFSTLALDHLNGIVNAIKKREGVILEEQAELLRQLNAKKDEAQYIKIARRAIGLHFSPQVYFSGSGGVTKEFVNAATVEELSAVLAPFGFRCLILAKHHDSSGFSKVTIEVLDNTM